MALNTEKNTYTLLFAVGLVVIVGTLLAAIDSSLKDKIRINKILEKQQNILYAIGINENEGNSVNFIAADKAEQEFNKYITKQIYIQGDQVIEDDKAYLIDVKKQKALAKDPSHKRKLPLFIANKDGRNLYVAPIRGKGLWDAIWAYVSVDENMIFLMNVVDYLAGDQDLISLRSREVTSRPLDILQLDSEDEQRFSADEKERMMDRKKKRWKFANMVLPSTLIIGFGVLRN